MVLYPLTGDTKWTKYHLLLSLILLIPGIQKVGMDMCVFPSQVLVLIFFLTIGLCYHQRGIQPNISFIFKVKGKGITDFEKKPYEYDVILF